MIARRRAVVATLFAMAVLLVGTVPAFAHGANDSNKAGVLVRQAIAHIVHDPNETMDAADKINDAKDAADKRGVDIDLVAQAGAALDRGDTHRARTLLERSIGARPHLSGNDPLPIRETRPLATGAESGIDVVTDPLAPHRGQRGGDWAALFGLIAIGALGVYLAQRFRPHTAKTA